MYDKALALDILNRLHQATGTILQRFNSIRSVSDFTGSTEGMERLDSICMLLIVIGESLKNLDKVTGGVLLPRYSEVDWKRAKGLRDIISHHYFDVDAEEIFHVCATRIEPMRRTIAKIIDELS
jgi:uncharacterized protein with HEPN domain